MRDPSLMFDVAAFAYAHRGLWDDKRPENSIAAFEAAAQAGVGCELDVRITLDGRLVVFHDATLERMCGRPERVDTLAFRDIRRLRLPDGSSIPTLEEALEAMAGWPTLIEIKIDDPPVADALRDRRAVAAVEGALKFSNAPAAVMSFDSPALWRFWDKGDGGPYERPVGQLLEPVAEIGLDMLQTTAKGALGGAASYLAPHVTSLAAAAELFPNVPRVTWTVRTPEHLAAAHAYGAAPIFEGFSPALAKPAGNPI